jgi:hypothetical protein
VRAPSHEERKKLHRIGDAPVIVTLSLAEGGTIELATKAEHLDHLLGPFAPTKHAPGVAVSA